MGGDTVLFVRVPEADPVVDRWRAGLDPAYEVGVPACVTVISPWFPPPSVPAAELSSLVATMPAFDLEFARLGTFPRTLWVAPEPAAPFVALIAAVAARWPRFPSYGGEFPTITPHLTVADACDPASLDHVAADVRARLPFRTRVTQVQVWARNSPAERFRFASAHPLADLPGGVERPGRAG